MLCLDPSNLPRKMFSFFSFPLYFWCFSLNEIKVWLLHTIGRIFFFHFFPLWEILNTCEKAENEEELIFWKPYSKKKKFWKKWKNKGMKGWNEETKKQREKERNENKRKEDKKKHACVCDWNIEQKKKRMWKKKIKNEDFQMNRKGLWKRGKGKKRGRANAYSKWIEKGYENEAKEKKGGEANAYSIKLNLDKNDSDVIFTSSHSSLLYQGLGDFLFRTWGLFCVMWRDVMWLILYTKKANILLKLLN